VSAYNSGDVEKARDLLTRALEQGSDGADVFLDRLNRVGATVPGAGVAVDGPERGPSTNRRVARGGGRPGTVTAALLAVCVAAAMLVGGLPIGTWLSELQTVEPAPTARPLSPEPLPVVRASELMLDRARTLHADGRLRDALRTLDAIRMADPVRLEADQLRADIQREMFVAAGISGSFQADPGRRP
jgi:hypothetical protein